MAKDNLHNITKLYGLIEKQNIGTASTSKLKALLERSIGTSISEEDFNELMTEMDVDDGDNVSLSKFVSVMLTKEKIGSIRLDLESLRKIFKEIDEGKLGLLHVEDFKEVLNCLGVNYSAAEYAQIMNIAGSFLNKATGVNRAQDGEDKTLAKSTDTKINETEQNKDERVDKQSDSKILNQKVPNNTKLLDKKKQKRVTHI